jgi:hypothetical protein
LEAEQKQEKPGDNSDPEKRKSYQLRTILTGFSPEVTPVCMDEGINFKKKAVIWHR